MPGSGGSLLKQFSQTLSSFHTDQWAVIVAVLALFVSLFSYNVQTQELESQNKSLQTQQAELETAQQALRTQADELQTQRDALSIQQEQLDKSEKNFQVEGALLEATLGFWRDAQPGERESGEPHMLARINGDRGGTGLPSSVTLTRGDFDHSPRFYIELTVINAGRGAGAIERVSGISRLEMDANCGSLRSGFASDPECHELNYNFTDSNNVLCVDQEGVEGPCSFPVSIPSKSIKKFRYDLTGLLAHPKLSCDKAGTLSLTAHEVSDIFSEMFVSMDIINNKNCPIGAGVVVPRPQ